MIIFDPTNNRNTSSINPNKTFQKLNKNEVLTLSPPGTKNRVVRGITSVSSFPKSFLNVLTQSSYALFNDQKSLSHAKHYKPDYLN